MARYRVSHEVSFHVTPWKVFCYTAATFLLGMAVALLATSST